MSDERLDDVRGLPRDVYVGRTPDVAARMQQRGQHQAARRGNVRRLGVQLARGLGQRPGRGVRKGARFSPAPGHTALPLRPRAMP